MHYRNCLVLHGGLKLRPCKKRGTGSGPHGNKNAPAFVPSSHSLLNAATNLISPSPLVSPRVSLYTSISWFAFVFFSISVSPSAASSPPCPPYRDFPRNCGLDKANAVSFALDLLFPGLHRPARKLTWKKKNRI